MCKMCNYTKKVTVCFLYNPGCMTRQAWTLGYQVVTTTFQNQCLKSYLIWALTDIHVWIDLFTTFGSLEYSDDVI